MSIKQVQQAFTLSTSFQVMGVINCSADSFFGAVANVEQAVTVAAAMVEAGAQWLDIGGEATNPVATVYRDDSFVQQELDTVLPVIEAIRQRFDVAVSVDTSTPIVMQAAIELGVAMINDQRALAVPGALEVVAPSSVAVVLMHWFQGRTPGDESKEGMFDRIVGDCMEAVARCVAAGIGRDRLVVDPGFGQGHYGKDTSENYYLLAQLPRFKQALADLPILVGWSRKSMIGSVLDEPVERRLYGSVAAAVLAARLGANIIRVHDVKATVDALKIVAALQRAELMAALQQIEG